MNWRRWRAPAAVAGLVLLAAVLTAVLEGPAAREPLDPADTGPNGAHALVALLRARGQTVLPATTVSAALSGAGAKGTTLVITNPALLDVSQRRQLAGSAANLLILGPAPGSLGALAPQITLAGVAPVARRQPTCSLTGATLAGDADLGGAILRSGVYGSWRAVYGSSHCYPAGASAGTPFDQVPAFLVRYPLGSRTVTVLGTGAPLTNGALGKDGNAALAMNLLNAARIVWLVPANAAPAGAGPRSLESLYPRAVYLVSIETGLAVVLAALWRMRRFGPLVAEPLPVVVRASETVEGHGRLYRSRRARDRAAAALRAATLSRIALRLGLPRDVSPDVTCQELASRTGRSPDEIRVLLFGPAPQDDGALVTLATDLDTIEGQVLAP